MILLCPFLHCKALRTAMYKRYINSIIITLLSFKQNFTKPNKQIFTKKKLYQLNLNKKRKKSITIFFITTSQRF